MYTLLIVDDEQIERDALSSILGDAYEDKCQIATAENGHKAITKATSLPADIILMDIEMPGISGLEAAKYIKQELPHCRIIILTAFQQFQYAKEAINIGTEHYLLKPVSNTELFSHIDHTIMGLDMEQRNVSARTGTDSIGTEHFVLSAISGCATEETLREQLQSLGLSFTSGFFCIARCEPPVNGQSMQRAEAELNLLHDDVHFLCYAQNDKLLIAILLDEPDTLCTMRETIAGDIQGLQKRFDMQVMVGVGDVVDDPCALVYSYELAREAIGACTDREPMQIAEEGKWPRGTEQRLFRLLLDRNIDESLRCMDTTIDALYCALHRSSAVIHTVHRLLRNVVSMIEKEIGAACDLSIGNLPAADDSVSRQALIDYARELLPSWICSLSQQSDSRLIRIREEINAFIQENFAKELTISRIAKGLHYSEPHFSRLFSRCFQCSFITYLTEVRVQAAQRMLTMSQDSVREVSAAVGYPDANYFAKVFRKICGISPTEYRRKMNRSATIDTGEGYTCRY